MRQRIDISEVESETKIRAKYLRALENEEYNLLPGPAYVKSFLRTYAEFLNLDSRELVNAYKAQHAGEEDHAIFGGRREPVARRSGPPVWVLAVGAIVVLVILLLLLGVIGG